MREQRASSRTVQTESELYQSCFWITQLSRGPRIFFGEILLPRLRHQDDRALATLNRRSKSFAQLGLAELATIVEKSGRRNGILLPG
jgi:hypothetical protein